MLCVHVISTLGSVCIALQWWLVFLDQWTTADIREAAVAVNDRLKKLIIPEDDEDFLTDQNDSTAESAHTQTTLPHSASTPPSQPTGHTGSSTSAPLPQPPSARDHTAQTGTKQTSPKQSASTSPNADSTSASGTLKETSKEGGEKEKEEELMVERKEPRLHLLAVLGVLIPHMKFTLTETRMETLRWVIWLHQQLPKRVN